MKKTSLAILVSLFSVVGAAYAQDTSTEIRESTDPAKVAEVEQRAAEIIARQQSADQMNTSGSSESGEAKSTKKSHMKSHSAKSGKGDASGASSGTNSEAGTGSRGAGQGTGSNQ